jgi:hypothetical protein
MIFIVFTLGLSGIDTMVLFVFDISICTYNTFNSPSELELGLTIDAP